MTFPTTWEPRKLGELAQYINGKAFKPDDWKTSGLPIIRIQYLTDPDKPFNYCDKQVEARYLIDDGDLLISWSATLGSFIWDRGPAVPNQHIFKAVTNVDLVERDFLHFLMLETLDEMATHAHGIAMKHITKGKFDAIVVAIPSSDEQRRIVARINECMERLNEIESSRIAQEQAATNLMRSARRELLGTADRLFDGWTKVRLDGLADVIYGISEAISANRDPSIGPPIVRMANISFDGHLDLSDVRYCAIPKGRQSHFALKRGDLLLNWRSGSASHVGKTAIFDEDGLFTCASFILRIRAFPNVHNRYLRHVLNFMRAEGIFSGSSRMQINHKLNAAEFSAFLGTYPSNED